MFRLIIFLLMALPAGCIFSKNERESSSCAHTDRVLRCVQYVRNYDGDTVTFNVPDLHPLIGRQIRVRVEGADTPEIRGKTQCEKQKAKEARDAVQAMFEKAKSIELRDVKRGKYFRILADIVVDGKSLKDELIRLGLAHPYNNKGKNKPVDWCL